MTDWTRHGGGLAAATAHYGVGATPWLDLSTGINPHPWPGTGSIEIDWRRLPEQEHLAELEASAAAYFGAAPENVCAVPGTEIGLRTVGRAIGGTAGYVWPTYGTHRDMVAGAVSVAIDDIEGLDGTLILANPNNPDGRVLSRDVLLSLIEHRPDDSWLLLDEAFADADPSISVADQVHDARRLIVFRSFGKFFGLAGLRLGFVLAPSAIISQVRDMLGAWPVSSAACAIGSAAYGDADWIGAMRRQLEDEAAELDAMLARSGLRSIGKSSLFRLIETDDARALFERLAGKSILTRPFADNPRRLRIGLPGSMTALDRLATALCDG